VVLCSATSFCSNKRREEDKVYGNDCYLKAADYVSNEYDVLMTHILKSKMKLLTKRII
jgi:hypothetical protein